MKMWLVYRPGTQTAHVFETPEQAAAVMAHMPEGWRCVNLGAVVGALRRIARPHDCGCKPCTGQCRSQDALSIEIEAMRDEANAAVAALAQFAEPVA